jgi:hypothetical protein
MRESPVWRLRVADLLIGPPTIPETGRQTAYMSGSTTDSPVVASGLNYSLHDCVYRRTAIPVTEGRK